MGFEAGDFDLFQHKLVQLHDSAVHIVARAADNVSNDLRLLLVLEQRQHLIDDPVAHFVVVVR